MKGLYAISVLIPHYFANISGVMTDEALLEEMDCKLKLFRSNMECMAATSYTRETS
jgi:hypothetical protein